MNEADKVTAELMALAMQCSECGRSWSDLEQAIRRAVDCGDPVAWRWQWAHKQGKWMLVDKPFEPGPDEQIQPLYARNKP